jgi:hypothetical protein
MFESKGEIFHIATTVFWDIEEGHYLHRDSAPPLSEAKRAKCRVARRESLREFAPSPPEPSHSAHNTRSSQVR